MPRDSFAERMDTLVERMKAQPRAAGFDEILIPGEREARTEHERSRDGIPLSAEVTAALQAEAQTAGIAFPESVARNPQQ
jgi:LDH2 family malate/lactate/ureidoglycolate dehydrogenase